MLRAGGVELDCLRRSAHREGRALDLSVKEFAVLEVLMDVSPSYLSAEQLLERVWDENANPFTRTVMVTIGRLRRKLGEPTVIETAVGVGYRIWPRGAEDPYGGHLVPKPGRWDPRAPLRVPGTQQLPRAGGGRQWPPPAPSAGPYVCPRAGSNSSTWVKRMLFPEGSRKDVSTP